MKQADLGLNLATKRTRKREFLDEMNRVVPWAELVALVDLFAPVGVPLFSVSKVTVRARALARVLTSRHLQVPVTS